MNATTREISNYDDTIDSREIIERIAELTDKAADGDSLLDQDERIELAALRNLAEQGETFEDWKYGVTLIRNSYFVTYAQELADDTVTGMSDAQWPFTCIDWEKAAWELRMDYTSVDFDGVTYWAR